jgi:hypothetical protein
MTQQNRPYDYGELVIDYSGVEKCDINALINAPLICHDLLVIRSNYAEKGGSKRKATLILSHVDHPEEKHRVLIWREYVILQLDKLAGKYLRYNTIGQLYHLDVPFTMRIDHDGRFYIIRGIGHDSQEGGQNAD